MKPDFVLQYVFSNISGSLNRESTPRRESGLNRSMHDPLPIVPDTRPDDLGNETLQVFFCMQRVYPPENLTEQMYRRIQTGIRQPEQAEQNK
jgi:hypothetical protein